MESKRVFTVLVRPSEDGGYWAEVVECPGCLTQGETLDELRHNVVDAIESWMDVVEEDDALDRPVPTPDIWRIEIPSKASVH